MAITNTIRDIREKAGLTQEAVAERLGTTRSNYAYLENRGEKLTVEQLQSIASALGVAIIDLLGTETSQLSDDLEKELVYWKGKAEFNKDLYDRVIRANYSYEKFVDGLCKQIDSKMMTIIYEYKISQEKDLMSYIRITEIGETRLINMIGEKQYDEIFRYRLRTPDMIHQQQLYKVVLILKRDEYHDYKLLTEIFNHGLLISDKIIEVLENILSDKFNPHLQMIEWELNRDYPKKT